VAATATDCPTYIRRGAGSSAMAAAGPGTMVTVAKPGLERPPPCGETSAVTRSAPTAPAVARPVESTVPSKCPPDWNQRTRTSPRERPAESKASATRRIVSPTVTAASAGRTTTEATGVGAGVCCSSAARKNSIGCSGEGRLEG